MERVKYWDYLEDYKTNREEYLKAVDAVFSSGRLILGPEVTKFEESLAGYCGVSHAVGVNSCTDALFLAMKALDIGCGDEVITVANTAVPTVAAVRAAGATPVFADVDESTFTMDPEDAERKITSSTKCILPVHLAGQMADMERITAISLKHNLKIVEDCAQSCGASCKGKVAGSIGSIGAFSFYPTKVLGAFGDGGALTTDDPDLNSRLKRLRMYGMESTYYAEEEGYNSRLDEVQAAILSIKLKRLDSSVERRRDIAKIYNEGLIGAGDIKIPSIMKGNTHQYYLYTVRTEHRDELMQHLSSSGIDTKINYPWEIHQMRGYSFLGYREGDLPVTEKLAKTILSLPMYSELTDDSACRVIDAVRDFFRGRG